MNSDGFIDRNEFKSALTTFDDVADGKNRFSENLIWRSYSFVIKDSQNKSDPSFMLHKNIAKVVLF